MNIKYIQPAKRNTVIARIRLGDGDYFDKSTGIKSRIPFDNLTQSFLDVEEGKKLNNKLDVIREDLEERFVDFGKKKETKLFQRFISPQGKSIEDVNFTVRGLMNRYSSMLDEGLVLTNKSKPLSPQSILTRKSAISRLLKLSDRILDFDFGRYNALTMDVPSSRKKWEEFKSSMINELIGDNLQDVTIWNLVSQFKAVIRYMLILNNIEATTMLSKFNYSYQKKDVKVLSKDQYDFVINSYDKLREECGNYSERVALDYWIVALTLCMRMSSMRSLSSNNIYTIDDRLYLRYQPEKTMNSSAKEVDVPVPPLVSQIFSRNMENLGRPLPEVSKDFRGPELIRSIAMKYDVFKSKVTVIIRKGNKVEEKSVPEWKRLTMHMGRATGITEYLERGVPEAVVKTISAHTIDSTAFPRYVNIRKKVTAEYLDKVWA